LLYLRGSGTQHLGDRAQAVERGTLLVIPPGRAHRFEKARPMRPICLALDFETAEPVTWRECGTLSPSDLAKVEQWLVDLHATLRTGTGTGKRGGDRHSIRSGALILQILACLEAAVEGTSSPRPGGPVTAAVRKAIRENGLVGLTPGGIAVRLGRTLDHLNRRTGAECGLTVGELIHRARLERSGELLRTTARSIGDIGSEVGMDDQNYFARWFRRQTGQTPTRWREAMRSVAP
jgi:AraC family L-rhamnose operon transcriptional activator RhaR